MRACRAIHCSHGSSTQERSPPHRDDAVGSSSQPETEGVLNMGVHGSSEGCRCTRDMTREERGKVYTPTAATLNGLLTMALLSLPEHAMAVNVKSALTVGLLLSSYGWPESQLPPALQAGALPFVV